MRRFREIVICLLLIQVAGCPQPPDDGFEPNDTFEQATLLVLETEFKARVVQGNRDVLALTLDARSGNEDRQLEFDLTTINGEECAAFTVTAPDGAALYQDTNRYCGRSFSAPVSVPGASLTEQDGGFILRVPALSGGTYFLTIEEKGRADNVIDYVWSYQLTARIVP